MEWRELGWNTLKYGDRRKQNLLCVIVNTLKERNQWGYVKHLGRWESLEMVQRYRVVYILSRFLGSFLKKL